MNKLIKIIIYSLAIILVLLLAVFYYFFVGSAPVAKNITWGVNFSKMQAENLKLDWKKTYLAIINDLGAKNIKLHTQWDWIEGQKGEYYFDDIDWQINRAEESGVKIIYVLGMKSGRWPECHIPGWASILPKEKQQEELLDYIREVVIRYKNSKAIAYWQAENEPLLDFGECPWRDKNFLIKEVNLIKSLDATRPVIISDSGDLSLWIEAAKIGDVLGITTYKKVWAHITDNIGFNVNSPLPAITFWRKANIINKIFKKRVINVELQAEPWTSKPFYDVPLQEQEKTMNLNQFKINIEYAKQTGLDEFYLWGAEWWFWLKEKQNNPAIWNEAKRLF